MLTDRNQRNIALIVQVAEPFTNPCRHETAPAVPHDFRFDELTWNRAGIISRKDLQFIARLLVDRNETGAMAFRDTINTEHPVRPVAQPANDGCAIGDAALAGGFDS